MIRRVAILPLLAFLSITFVLAQTTRPPEAQESTEPVKPIALTVAGLSERVIIRRDKRGIPYIEAGNDRDLYFAQGYATATDRLWQMELLRRTARGELAEIFGEGALAEDKQRRTMGYTRVVEAEIKRFKPKSLELLESYARGVNALIDVLDEQTLPTEFKILQIRPRPWTVPDSMIIVKMFAETLNTTWQADFMRAAFVRLPREKRAALFPEISPLDVIIVGSDKKVAPAKPVSVETSEKVSNDLVREVVDITNVMEASRERLGLYAESLAASNNWVVNGKRTASGKPLLANDPHLAPAAPGIWYMTHLAAPGIRVAGVTAPGLPGIVIGHNGHVAWGFTNVGPDVQDLYLERFDQDNPTRYQIPGGWKEAEVHTEQIKVRKSFASNETNVVELKVTVTRNGPVILERDGNRYSLKWTALDPSIETGEGFYGINRARNWREFTQALSRYTGPMQNMVYADLQGNIGYYAAGPVPMRKAGNGSMPYDGSTDAGDWTGFIPFEQLPSLYNPPAGFILTANQRIVGTDYPYFLSRQWPPPYRARRIFQLLEQKSKLTAEDFRRIQGDTYSFAGVNFATEFLKTIKSSETPVEGKLLETVRELEKWNGHADADSKAALLVGAMRTVFQTRILNAALGQDLAKLYTWANAATFIDHVLTEKPALWLPKEFKDYTELFRACEADMRSGLVARLGADESKWTWGQLAPVRFPHPLLALPAGEQFLIPPVPQNGGGGTVNAGRGVSMRMIADLSNWDKTQMGLPLGSSGDPASPHWKDQLDDWRNVTPALFPFSDRAVKAASRSEIVLTPKAP